MLRKTNLFLILLPFVVCCKGQVNENKITIKVNDTLFKVEEYHLSGKKSSEYFLDEKGKLNGKYFEWSENGVKLTDWTFRKGLRNGLQISWWSEGKISLMENYIDGLENGMNYSFDLSGKLMVEEEYELGKLISRKESLDFYKPDENVFNDYLSKGLDSVTVLKIVRENLSGYVIKTDSGSKFISDNGVAIMIENILHEIDSINQTKQNPVKIQTVE